MPTEVRIAELTDRGALNDFLAEPDRLALILFEAGWSRTARRLEEQLIRVLGDLPIRLARLDVERWPEAAHSYGVHGVPALVLFRGGQAAARRLGEVDEGELRDWLEIEDAA